jgi:beta-lactamase class A
MACIARWSIASAYFDAVHNDSVCACDANQQLIHKLSLICRPNLSGAASAVCTALALREQPETVPGSLATQVLNVDRAGSQKQNARETLLKASTYKCFAKIAIELPGDSLS